MPEKMTKGDEVEQLVSYLCGEFNLHARRIFFKAAETAHKESEDIAATVCSSTEGYLSHTVTVYPCFFELEFENQFFCVVHEFGHIISNDMTTAMDVQQFDDYVPRTVLQTAVRMARRAEESFCDHFASALAPILLPLWEEQLEAMEDEEEVAEEAESAEEQDVPENEADGEANALPEMTDSTVGL